MNKSKYIQEKVSPLLLPLGFVYSTAPNMWRYERSIPGPQGAQYKQAIYIQRSNFAKALYLRMDNGIPEQLSHLNANTIIPGEKRHQLPFSNDEEFKKIVDYCAQGIKNHLIPRLDSFSKIVVVDSPTVEDQVYVYEHHGELGSQLCQKEKIDYQIPIEKLQQIVYETISAIKGQTYTQGKSILMELSSLFGIWLEKNHQGQWEMMGGKAVRVQYQSVTSNTLKLYVPVLFSVHNCLEKVNTWPQPDEVRDIVNQIITVH